MDQRSWPLPFLHKVWVAPWYHLTVITFCTIQTLFKKTCNASSYNATTELYIGGFCPSVRMWSIPTISSRLARPPHLFFNHNLQMCVCVHIQYVSQENIQSSSGLVRGLCSDQSSRIQLTGRYWLTEPPQKWYFKPADRPLCCSRRALKRIGSKNVYTNYTHHWRPTIVSRTQLLWRK